MGQRHGRLEPEPLLLQRRGFDKLLSWVTGRLYVNERVDRHTGQPKNVLMLQFEVEEEFKNRMVRRIQGMWRCKKRRQMIRQLIKQIYQKLKVPALEPSLKDEGVRVVSVAVLRVCELEVFFLPSQDPS